MSTSSGSSSSVISGIACGFNRRAASEYRAAVRAARAGRIAGVGFHRENCPCAAAAHQPQQSTPDMAMAAPALQRTGARAPNTGTCLAASPSAARARTASAVRDLPAPSTTARSGLSPSGPRSFRPAPSRGRDAPGTPSRRLRLQHGDEIAVEIVALKARHVHERATKRVAQHLQRDHRPARCFAGEHSRSIGRAT